MNESEFEKMAREIMERFFVQFGEMSSANRDKESIISAALRTAYQAGMREGMKFENKLMMSELKKPRGFTPCEWCNTNVELLRERAAGIGG